MLRDENGRVLAVRGHFKTPGGGSAEQRATAFVNTFRAALGLAAGIELGEATVTGTKIQTVSFQLTAGGHRIEGGRLAVRLTPDVVFFVVISAPPSVPKLPAPTLDAAAAKARATELVSGTAVDGEPELVVYAPELLMRGTEPPRLAWRVSMQLAIQGSASAPVLFIDAVDGSELGRLGRVKRARERQVYDAQGCRFSDDFPGKQIYDELGVVEGATVWQEATTAWNFAADGCDFLKSAFAEERPCQPLVVHLNVEDAHDAYQLGGKLYFGTGALSDTVPLSNTESYRTFMHELGHALLRVRTDDLEYWHESGAIEEAMADVVSMLITKPAKWVVDPGHPDERNISNPSAAPNNPKSYAERRIGEVDDGEVHRNSVILSHAIWLATVEGLNVGNKTVAGMGYEIMTSILHELLRGYLGGFMTLHQVAAALITACMTDATWHDTFSVPTMGASFRDCGLLVNALAKVGISDPDGDLDGWPDTADNCRIDYNPYQEDTDRDRTGDLCETTKPPELPPDDPGVFPCPATIQTAEAGAWPLKIQWGEKPTPVYVYFCRYGKPGNVPTKYPGEITYRLRWAIEPVGNLGCGAPPPNPGSEISSDTHYAEISYPKGSIFNMPESTFYDDLKAVAPKLLEVVEQGSDASGQKVLPAGAAPCK